MKDIAPGMQGEILIKGPVVSKGYYNNSKATVDSIRDGWLCTGDIGILRDEKLYIVDRKKVRSRQGCIYICQLTCYRNLLNTKGIKLLLQSLKPYYCHILRLWMPL